MPLLPPLVSPEELRDRLGDERVRVFDTTVFLRRPVGGGPYTVESGRESYARGHIPGAGFADIPGALSDPSSPFAFTLPTARHFAAVVGGPRHRRRHARRRVRTGHADVGDAAVVAAALLRAR